jgi:hypothetical protein
MMSSIIWELLIDEQYYWKTKWKSQLLIDEQYNERTASREQYTPISRHGSCNCSSMSSLMKELLIDEQYNIEASLVSSCFASSKLPQYNGSGKDATI